MAESPAADACAPGNPKETGGGELLWVIPEVNVKSLNVYQILLGEENSRF